MGLNSGDIEKVPKGTTVEECYFRIYDWHKNYGKILIQLGEGERYRFGRLDPKYVNAYLRLIDRMPPPDQAAPEDMDMIFWEIIAGLMEWSYHEIDDKGVKMAAYAHYAFNFKYGSGGFSSGLLRDSIRKSHLFNEFRSQDGSIRYD